MAKDEMERETALRDRREGSAERNRAAGIVPEIIPSLPSRVVTAWKLHKDRMSYFIGVRASGLRPDINWRILVKDGVAEMIDDTDSDNGGYVVEDMKIADYGPGPLGTDRPRPGATSDDDKRREQRVPGSADLRQPADDLPNVGAVHPVHPVHPDHPANHLDHPQHPDHPVDMPGGLPTHGGQAVNPGSMPEHRNVGEAARNPVVDPEHKPAVTHEVRPVHPEVTPVVHPEVKPVVVGHGPVISPEPKKK